MTTGGKKDVHKFLTACILSLIALPAFADGYDDYAHDTVLFQFVTAPTTPAPVAYVPPPTLPQGQVVLTQEQMQQIAAMVVQQLRAQQVPAATGLPATPAAAPSPRENPAVLTYQAVAILATSCMQCHTGPAGRGKVNLFDAGGAFHPGVGKGAIYAAVKDDSMPKTPQKLTAEQKDILRRWSQS